MASGDPVVAILSVTPPTTLNALNDVRIGGSTPAETVALYDFDAATQWYIDMQCKLIGYDGGGLTWDIPWSASTATSGSVVWGIGIRYIDGDAEDICR